MVEENSGKDITGSDLAELFGDALTQETLENFLAQHADAEGGSEAQGTLVSAVTATIVFEC
jgi:hypothetical protein